MSMHGPADIATNSVQIESSLGMKVLASGSQITTSSQDGSLRAIQTLGVLFSS